MSFYTTKEEYREWLENPTTQKYMEVMRELVKEGRVLLGKKVKWTENETFLSGKLTGIESAWNLEEFFEFSEDKDD